MAKAKYYLFWNIVARVTFGQRIGTSGPLEEAQPRALRR
jgi:hypothetical protein